MEAHSARDFEPAFSTFVKRAVGTLIVLCAQVAVELGERFRAAAGQLGVRSA